MMMRWNFPVKGESAAESTTGVSGASEPTSTDLLRRGWGGKRKGDQGQTRETSDSTLKLVGEDKAKMMSPENALSKQSKEPVSLLRGVWGDKIQRRRISTTPDRGEGQAIAIDPGRS